MNQIDEQKMENIEERENIYDIPTQIEMIHQNIVQHRSAKSTDRK